MGLLDILNGMQNGPRRQQPSNGGGMSPWMMALLGLLAYKAAKGGGLGNMLGGANDNRSQPAQPGGGLGDLLGGLLGGGGRPGMDGAGGGLGGMLGGLLGGAAAGGALNQGLRDVLGGLEQNGHGDAVKSWIGSGENQRIAPDDLARAAGIDDIDAVARQVGMPREQMLSELSERLPEFVDQLTPNGDLPTDEDAARWV